MALAINYSPQTKSSTDQFSMQADYFSNNILNQGLIILFSEKKNCRVLRICSENCWFRWRTSCFSVFVPFCWESQKKQEVW